MVNFPNCPVCEALDVRMTFLKCRSYLASAGFTGSPSCVINLFSGYLKYLIHCIFNKIFFCSKQSWISPSKCYPLIFHFQNLSDVHLTVTCYSCHVLMLQVLCRPLSFRSSAAKIGVWKRYGGGFPEGFKNHGYFDYFFSWNWKSWMNCA